MQQFVIRRLACAFSLTCAATRAQSGPAQAEPGPDVSQQSPPEDRGPLEEPGPAQERSQGPPAAEESSPAPAPALQVATPPPPAAEESSPAPAPAPQVATPPPPADDENLEAELARELGNIQAENAGAASEAASRPVSTPAGSASAYGLSNTMNPAVSANVTLLAGGTTRRQQGSSDEVDDTGELRSGIRLQEVELRFSAIVDPYFRADVTLSGNLDELGFEEAYLSTLELPRVTVRAGQLFANFGRHNLLHTHAFPFLTAPLPWRVLLGPEGFKAPGVSVDLLLPLPFFAELNLQAFSADWRPFGGEIADDPDTAANEAVPDRRKDTDLVYLGHLKTLFDVGASSTLELGGTYTGGRNGFGKLTSVVAGDLTFKWRPVEAERYVGIDWTSEYLWIERAGAPEDRTVGGAYSGLRFQFLRRWWAQARAAVLGLPAAGVGRSYRAEALLAFVPSEFSLLRLQYAYETGNVDPDPVHELFLQATATIGPHPAHAY